jgi:hypothetical protein
MADTKAALRSLLAELGDSRIELHGRHATEQFEFYSNGYSLLDQVASEAAAEGARWIVFTNGDNE